jgi:hypothetical protein
VSATLIKVVVLHVAQGMGSLIKIYEDDNGTNKLTALCLVDMGSDTPDSYYSVDGVDGVMTALAEMKNTTTGNGQPRLEWVAISHQDRDHWTLLPKLLARIKTDEPTTQLGNLYYGGLNWAKDATTAITDFANHFTVTPDPFSVGSDYSTPGTKKRFSSVKGVIFRRLLSNFKASGSPDIIKNAGSAVVVVEFGGKRVLLPGDATAATLQHINGILTKWKEDDEGNPLLPCLLLSAPHHGALRTLADDYRKYKADPQLKIAAKFTDFVRPDAVAASAGFETKHKHPAAEVMEVLTPWATLDWIKHTYVVYRFAHEEWVQMEETEFGAFTTVLKWEEGIKPKGGTAKKRKRNEEWKPIPIERRSWSWAITATGEVTYSYTVNNRPGGVPPGPVKAVPRERR